MKQKYKYIYGPVNSWRLGRSLGIDVISNKEKICSFNCIYCQLGPTKKFITDRRIYVKTEEILQEFKRVKKGVETDYITFSGTGEPTLALNLGEVIEGIKKIQEEDVPIAVITNSSLIYRKDVKEDLEKADFIMFKLDASFDKILRKVNRPPSTITFKKIVQGIKNFKKIFEGKLALQIMFVEKNKSDAKGIAKVAREIKPDEVQINTPLRSCKVNPLSEVELKKIEQEFKGLNVINVYEYKNEAPQAKTIDEKGVRKRRS